MTTGEAVQKVRDVVRLRHLSLATEESYTMWLRRFARFVSEQCDPLAKPEQKMAAFLTQLARQEVSASTQNQAFCALLFFYREVLKIELGKVDLLRAKKPVMVRTAPSVDEVRALLAAVPDVGGYPTALLVRMLYGIGLRVTEPLNLRVKDVLLSESRLIIRGAKGGKDRVVALPCSLVPELKAQLTQARAVWEMDKAKGLPVALPGLLAQKYSAWAHSWQWAWVFPALRPCQHPRTGETVRWRCHEANVQRAVRQAARPLGLCITPHHLRHAYATHCLNRGVNVKALQAALGHSQVETTIGYCHAEACSVPSPLESCTAQTFV